MPEKFYQEFYIRQDVLVKFERENAEKVLSRGEELLSKLTCAGYEVLVSNDCNGQAPITIVIGNNKSREEITADFYRLTQEFRIPYFPGKIFIKRD
jgi:hypothetical protein